MRQIYEDPILGEFVVVATIDVYHAKLACFTAAGIPHEPARGAGGKVGPPKETAKVAFGKSADVLRFGPFRKACPERRRVLLHITVYRVRRADPRWAPPKHIFCPSLRQFIPQ